MIRAILHYVAVFIDGQAMAFACVERAKSAKDRPGHYGYAATKYGIEYVPFSSVAEVFATIERQGLHFVSLDREPFSEDL